MNARVSLQARVDDYLAERRRQGFQLRSRDTLLAGFARFVAARHHRGPVTVELVTEWVREGKGGHGSGPRRFTSNSYERRIFTASFFARSSL